MNVAMEPPGRSPAIAPVLWLCFATWTFDFHHLILASFLSDVVAHDLCLRPTHLGWIHGLTLAAAAGGAWVTGRMADRGRIRSALGVCLLVPAAGAVLTAGAHGLTTLGVGRIITGFGAGGGWGIGHILVQGLATRESRDRLAALLQCASPAGVVTASLVSGFLAPALDWRWATTASALPGVLVLLVPRVIPGEWRPRSAPVVAANDAPRSGEVRAVLVISALLALQMTTYWCSFAWLPSQLRATTTFGPSQIALTTIVVATLQAVANMLFARVAARIGTRRAFAAAGGTLAASLAALAAFAQSVERNPSVLIATLGGASLACGLWSAFAGFFAESVAACRRTSVASASYNLARATSVLTQPIVGWMYELHGTHRGAFLLAAACSLASAAVVSRLPPPSPSAVSGNGAERRARPR